MSGLAGMTIIGLGILALTVGRNAAHNHTVVFWGQSWLSPPWAYIAAVLCFLFGAIFIFFWLLRRRSQ
jgi:hypothetical protein